MWTMGVFRLWWLVKTYTCCKNDKKEQKNQRKKLRIIAHATRSLCPRVLWETSTETFQAWETRKLPSMHVANLRSLAATALSINKQGCKVDSSWNPIWKSDDNPCRVSKKRGSPTIFRYKGTRTARAHPCKFRSGQVFFFHFTFFACTLIS